MKSRWAATVADGGRSKMSRTSGRVLTVVMALTLVLAACSASTKTSDSGGTAKAQPKLDYKAIGLWNDGPCDSARPPLKIGLMTVFESPRDLAEGLRRPR